MGMIEFGPCWIWDICKKSVPEDCKIKLTVSVKATDLFLQMVNRYMFVKAATVDVISQEQRDHISQFIWNSLSLHLLIKSNSYSYCLLSLSEASHRDHKNYMVRLAKVGAYRKRRWQRYLISVFKRHQRRKSLCCNLTKLFYERGK